MASVEFQDLDASETNDNLAEIYSKYNAIQRRIGVKFVELLGVKSGGRVLDMGCGTGEITSFIADQVGEGHVDGVDPDEERIKIAVQKHQKRNVNFVVGDSSSHFLLLNESHYDVHFSNFVFQWLTSQQKEVFVETAWRSLKPGGIIACCCQENKPAICQAISQWFPDVETRQELAERSATEIMLEQAGFVIESSEYIVDKKIFSNLNDFLTWFCISDYYDKSKISSDKVEFLAKKYVSVDGKVYTETLIYQIVARKPRS